MPICFLPTTTHSSKIRIPMRWRSPVARSRQPGWRWVSTRKTYFYRQSDIPEITELSWVLTCSAAKGLMNRAHAYKAAVQANEESGEDPDFGITMGLFSYPILMAADILIFNAHQVPVGRDQIQHVEMARDIAQRFNHHYGDTFTLPEAVVDDHVAVLQGLDGRKMSKSYGNTIPLFGTPKQLQNDQQIKPTCWSPVSRKTPMTRRCFRCGVRLRTRLSVKDATGLRRWHCLG